MVNELTARYLSDDDAALFNRDYNDAHGVIPDFLQTKLDLITSFFELDTAFKGFWDSVSGESIHNNKLCSINNKYLWKSLC